jgi:site-specific recombinase XerD
VLEGRPWTDTSVRQSLRRVAARAGVRRRFALRQLRNAHAVEMAREGVPLNVIQRQPGRAQAPGAVTQTVSRLFVLSQMLASLYWLLSLTVHAMPDALPL